MKPFDSLVKAAANDDMAGNDARRNMMLISAFDFAASPLQPWHLRDGRRAAVRPVLADDAPRIQAFVRELSEQSRYQRFLRPLKELPDHLLAHFTQIDYVRQLTLVAIPIDSMRHTIVGIAQYVAEPERSTGELGLVVTDSWQRQGLGQRLLESLINCARRAGLTGLEGHVIAHNQPMLNLARKPGFRICSHPNESTVMRIVKPLIAAHESPAAAQAWSQCACG